VGYGWNTSHPITISKKSIILIYHYLHIVWATAFVAKRFETRLLQRLLRVHRGISLFMRCTDFTPGRGFPHVSSPTLTESSVFAQDIQDILEANHQAYRGPPALPAREDEQWESQLQDALLETCVTSARILGLPAECRKLILPCTSPHPFRLPQLPGLHTPQSQVQPSSRVLRLALTHPVELR
jgi:hypothetical protein